MRSSGLVATAKSANITTKAADMIEEWFDAAEESFNVSFSENKGTDDAIDTESASWREGTKWIIELADLQKKAEHINLLCPYLNGDPAMAADACVNGNCCKCGFKNKWKKLRAKLLQHGPRSFVNGGNEAGIQLQPGAPSVFMKLVELDVFESVPVDKEDSVSATIGAADDEEYGANSRKVRLENVRKKVSIIELLDMLDHSFVGMCQHRRTVARCKRPSSTKRRKGSLSQLTKCHWSFGAPGHGKGVWDGLGGTVCVQRPCAPYS